MLELNRYTKLYQMYQRHKQPRHPCDIWIVLGGGRRIFNSLFVCTWECCCGACDLWRCAWELPEDF